MGDQSTSVAATIKSTTIVSSQAWLADKLAKYTNIVARFPLTKNLPIKLTESITPTNVPAKQLL